MRRVFASRRMSIRNVLGGCLLALTAATSVAQPVDVLSNIASENASLTAQTREDQATLEQWSAELEKLRGAKRDLEDRLQWIEQRAAVYPLGQELAQALNEQLRSLPRQERFAVAESHRTDVLASVSDADLRVARALRALSDMDSAVTQRLSDGTAEASAEQRQKVRAGLAEQRDLLRNLADLERKRLAVLHDLEGASRDFGLAAQAARAKLNRFLFWIPAPPSTRTIGEFAPAFGWLSSPANWRSAGQVVRHELVQTPLWPSLAIVAAAALVALRRRLLQTLASITPAAIGHEKYRIGHALTALAITFALAAPVPLVLWTAGVMLLHASDTQSFALALGDAFLATTKLSLAVATLTWLLDRRGVAVRHFGWDQSTLEEAANRIRRFSAVFIPLCFVAALNGLDHAPFPNRESVGRLAFTLAMIALTASALPALSGREPDHASAARAHVSQVVRAVARLLVLAPVSFPYRHRRACGCRVFCCRRLFLQPHCRVGIPGHRRCHAVWPHGIVGPGAAPQSRASPRRTNNSVGCRCRTRQRGRRSTARAAGHHIYRRSDTILARYARQRAAASRESGGYGGMHCPSCR